MFYWRPRTYGDVEGWYGTESGDPVVCQERERRSVGSGKSGQSQCTKGSWKGTHGEYGIVPWCLLSRSCCLEPRECQDLRPQGLVRQCPDQGGLWGEDPNVYCRRGTQEYPGRKKQTQE